MRPLGATPTLPLNLQKAIAEERKQRKAAETHLEAITARSNRHFRARGHVEQKLKALQKDLAAAKKQAQQSAKVLAEMQKELAGKTRAVRDKDKAIQQQADRLASLSASYWTFRNIEMKLLAVRGKTSQQVAKYASLLMRLRRMGRRPPGGYSDRAGCHGSQ